MTRFILSTVVLLAISAFGYFSIFALSSKNGWSDMLEAAIEVDGTLPDTGEPLRTHYTGLVTLDAVLTVLVRFFYSCVTLERPALSAFTIYFGGQVLAAHTVLVIEGLRAGNKGTSLYL